MGINEFHNPGMIQSPGDGADMKEKCILEEVMPDGR